MIDLSGKSALVTGGSRGIGRACCELLARAGARVAVNYRYEQPQADGLVRSIEESGGTAFALSADVSRIEEAELMVEETIDRYAGLDILINNAAVWREGPVEEISDDEWAETVGINLSGVFYITRAAVPHLKKSSGRIVNVSSTAGQRGEALHSHYAATKGAVISFTKSLATELAPFGVRTNCVAPGWVATDMTADALRGRAGEEIAAGIPMGRVGRPEEIAGSVLFLVSELAGFVNGEILNVNGGAVLAG